MKITDIINQLIEAEGFLELDKFVNICLHHENLGYYASKNPFGTEGDFVTAPQMTTLFGEMIGLYIASYIEQKKLPNITIVELGGGNGFFMRDCLSVLSKLPQLQGLISVIMVESSPFLTTQQKSLLNNFVKPFNISWVNSLYLLEEAIEEENVFVFSNEFFDAFPFKQFVKAQQGWHEVVVKFAEEQTFNAQNEQIFYEFAHNDKINFSAQIQHYLLSLEINDSDVEEGSIVELSTEALSAFNFLCTILRQKKGQMITIDYGYFALSAQTFKPTIKAVKNHAEVDPLSHLGEADMTYLINFKAFSNLAAKNGLLNYGLLTQRDFFISIGIEKRLEMFIAFQQKKIQTLLKTATNKPFEKNVDGINFNAQPTAKFEGEIAAEIAAEIEKIQAKIHLANLAISRIISPAQMGELFKVHICESS